MAAPERKSGAIIFLKTIRHMLSCQEVYHGAFAGSSKAVAASNMRLVSAPAQVPTGWLKHEAPSN